MQHPEPDSNRLLCGDCLAELVKLGGMAFQLIYLDPPFNTNLRRVGEAGTQQVAYEDSFGAPAAYVAYMRPRLLALQRLLAANGSLFFHCDWRMSHHVRLLLDEVFAVTGGGGVFVNEIIWHYGLGAARAGRRLLSKHDVIFWYANSEQYTFNLLRAEPTRAMQAKYRHVDEQGNRYMNSYGKRYLLKGGKPLDDVWDIPSISPTSSERTGYPTQKPLALLNRIVQLATNPGDLVLDPFCGSGTTLVAAQRLGRAWIGIDANPQAVEVAGRRLGVGA
jgi:site-specific DNA-methyltransferase (adenine-specific)